MLGQLLVNRHFPCRTSVIHFLLLFLLRFESREVVLQGSSMLVSGESMSARRNIQDPSMSRVITLAPLLRHFRPPMVKHWLVLR